MPIPLHMKVIVVVVVFANTGKEDLRDRHLDKGLNNQLPH